MTARVPFLVRAMAGATEATMRSEKPTLSDQPPVSAKDRYALM